jgi:hypothetical protein
MLRYYRLCRELLTATVIMSTACGPTPAPVASPKADETKSAAYAQAVEQLNAMNREAEAAYKTGKSDLAAKIMEQEKPLVSRVLSAPKPTLAATEAASDLDELYGAMLLRNRHYGWARILFQGDAARWKHWQPATESTSRRLKAAESGVAECDRHLVE